MVSGSNEQLQQKLEYTLLNPDCHSWWISKMQSDTLEERYAIKLCFKLGKNAKRWKLDLFLWPRVQETEFPVEACFAYPFFFFFFFEREHWHDLHALGSHWIDREQGILCWGFKGVQEEIPSEEASTLQIGSVEFPPGQCTSPQLHPCHRLFDQDGHRQFLTLPIVQTLLPVTFGCSLSSEAVVMRQLRRWKRLWRRSLTRSHKRTSMGPCRSCWNGTTSALQPEEITSKGTRVSCVYYQ